MKAKGKNVEDVSEFTFNTYDNKLTIKLISPEEFYLLENNFKKYYDY